MRIAFVTETFPPEINGVARSVHRAVRYLAERGHAVHVLRPRQGTHDQPRVSGRIHECLTPGMPLPMYPDVRMGIPVPGSVGQLFRELHPDIVHVATEGPLGRAAVSAALRRHIPVTTDFRTNFHLYSGHYGFGWARGLVLTYLRNFHNRSACTTVPTHALHEELARDGFRNLTVIGRGVDTKIFHPDRRNPVLRRTWGARNDDLVVMYVGRLAPEKNVLLAVDAFEAIRAAHPRARMVFVGDGPLRRRLEQNGSAYIVTGWQRGASLAAHYSSGDVFLFPSQTETFGNVTLEAMASGLVVVAFAAAAARELIHDGVNGMLVAPGDSAEFLARSLDAAAMARMDSPVRAAARESAMQVSWESVLGRFERLLRAVASGRIEASDTPHLAGAA